MPEPRQAPSATRPIFKRPITHGSVAVVKRPPPSVIINQAIGQADPTYISPILFDVTFSESVTGFTADDVVISGTAGVPGGVSVTGSGANYTVAVVMVEPLEVTINQAAGQADPASTSPILFDVVFSRPVIGFTAADVDISGTAGATECVVTGSGAVYTVSVSMTAPPVFSMAIVDTFIHASLSSAMAVAISGDYAFVAADSSVAAINISDPTNLSLADSVSSAFLDGAEGIAISGSTAFVTGRDSNRLVSIDITDPTNISIISSYTYSGLNEGFTGVAISGIYAFVGAFVQSRFIVIDISNPASMSTVSSLNDIVSLDGALRIAVYGTTAFVTAQDSDRLTAINVDDPATTLPIFSSLPSTSFNSARGIAVAADGQHAYVTGVLAATLCAVNVSNPASMSIVDTFTHASLMDAPNEVAIVDHYALVSSGIDDTVIAIDIANPTNLVQAGIVTSASMDSPQGIACTATHAFVACTNNGALVAIELYAD